MKPLSPVQQKIYNYILEYFGRQGVVPHTTDIQDHFQYSANSTVIQHLDAIETKGYIKRFRRQKRSYAILDLPSPGSLPRVQTGAGDEDPLTQG